MPDPALLAALRREIAESPFVDAGQEGLKTRPQPLEDRRLADAQRKIGELAMDNDILRGLIEEMGRHSGSPRR